MPPLFSHRKSKGFTSNTLFCNSSNTFIGLEDHVRIVPGYSYEYSLFSKERYLYEFEIWKVVGEL
jgi:hypothetical protein